eukprot:6824989-Pyramimonas_sp.AAC.1
MTVAPSAGHVSRIPQEPQQACGLPPPPPGRGGVADPVFCGEPRGEGRMGGPSQHARTSSGIPR